MSLDSTLRLLVCRATTGCVLAATVHAQTSETVTELERFIAEESAIADSGDVLPTSRPVGSVFGPLAVVDLPRSVTVLTPELMRQFDIQDFSDLARIGAGAQQINYYGVPGSPTLRGAKGGVYFNGIQRAWQRNEMPLSFGSVEAMDVVKGPAPAHFGAGQVGGYANLIPKSPYFDRARGSLMVEVGEHDRYRAQLDVGGPLLLGGRPSAYRISLTGQSADSYYDRVGNDFVSIYGALKARLGDGLALFAGAEYFDFRSNENAGWNRPTQALIDRGEYVIGEPPAITSPAWGGRAVRTLLEFPITHHLAPAFSSPLHALAIPGDVARERIPQSLRALMLDLNDPAAVAQAYRVLPAASVPPFANPALQPVAAAALAQVAIAPQDAFVYTPAYFAAGGEVLTARIEGSTVLADEADYANSSNLLSFFELENTRHPRRTVRFQGLLDLIKTDKLSTYGYAIMTEQLVAETKLTVVEAFDWLEGLTLTYGGSVRFTDAKILQDFFAEPFSRRDITRRSISPNTVILTGPQRGPDGRNFWSPTTQGGANAHSKLWQWSGFAVAENHLTSRLATFTSVLLTHAPYTTQYPPEVDLVPANDPRRVRVRDRKTFASLSFSPILEVLPGVNVYGTFQRGTSLDSIMGGAIVGKENFAKNELLEAGVKTTWGDGRGFAALSVYDWEQTAFDQRTNRAEPLDGRGAEFEVTYQPTDRLTLLASASVQRVRRHSPLPFRAGPYAERDWALYGGVMGFQSAPGVPANNPDLVYPGTPEAQVKLFAIYTFESGFGLSGGPIWSDAYWHNFDRTLRLPATVVWHGSLFYRRPKWEAAVAVENLTDEDYFFGADPVFAANTIITKAPGTTAKVSVTVKF